MNELATLDAYGVLTEPATLKIQRLLPGPVERVWAYLTESKLRRQWLAAASKHIKALENAGLIRREVRGRTHLCHLEPGPLASAHQRLNYYERFWSDHLDLLEQLLLEEDAEEPPPRKGDDQ